jgi:hypothetical protein
MKPAWDLSRRAYVVRNLTTAGTSAVSGSVASDNVHIGEKHEYSMTPIVDADRRVAAGPKSACPYS